MEKKMILALYKRHLDIFIELNEAIDTHTKIGDRILEDDTSCLEDDYAELESQLEHIKQKTITLVNLHYNDF